MNSIHSQIRHITLNNQTYTIGKFREFVWKQIQNFPEWEQAIYDFIFTFLDDSDHIIQQSSGTTGEPKTFKLSKAGMIQSAEDTINYFNLKTGDKALLCLPVDYIAGKMMIVRALIAGLNLLYEVPSSNPDLSRYQKIHFSAMVPIQVEDALKQPAFENIDKLIIGGSKVSNALASRLNQSNTQCFETYGMAETYSHVAVRKINGTSHESHFEALPGISFETDERGCLVIHTRRLKKQLITNDLVELTGTTKFKLLGRYDDLINTGGIKINPKVLENKISSLIDYNFALIGLPDSTFGEVVSLVIETDQPVDKKKLQCKLSENLSKFQIPKQIITIRNIPRNASFKIDRKKLRAVIQNKGIDSF